MTVLFGGKSGSSITSSDTWEWDGSDVDPASAPPGPSARYRHAMAYHAGIGKTLLFGGYTTDGYTKRRRHLGVGRREMEACSR